MSMIGILLNCKSISDYNIDLIHSLEHLVKICTFIKVQINVTKSNDPGYDRLSNPVIKDRFIITTQNIGGEPTNANLRGRYTELNTEYVFFMDDDFEFTDLDHLIKVFESVIAYMDSHPTCTITRFNFDNSSNTNFRVMSKLSSTSMGCGLLLRNDCKIFNGEQLNWSWRTDDFTIVLNAVMKGFGIEVTGHGIIHHIKGSSTELKFDKKILDPVVKYFNLDDSQFDIDGDQVWYNKPDSVKLGLRNSLVALLMKYENNNPPIDRLINVVSTSTSSMIYSNHQKFLDNRIVMDYCSRTPKPEISSCMSTRDSIIGVIKRCDYLIVSAGTLGETYPTESGVVDLSILDCMKWNLDLINLYIKYHKDNGRVIILGSVAADRSYPTHPTYAGEKAFMRLFSQSLTASSNVLFNYITIPSVKSRMCDHGFESYVIADHIINLVSTNRELDC